MDKKYIKETAITTIVLTFISYVAISFVLLDFNPFEWQKQQRAMLMASMFLSIIVSILNIALVEK